MKRVAGTAAVVGGVAAGAVRTVRKATGGGGDGGRGHDPDRWHVVTVNRPRSEVETLPGPLGQMRDRVEIELRPAPGDKGTELAARLRGGAPSGAKAAVAKVKGDSPVEELRAALRATKSILETGEVLQPDRPKTTKATPLNAPLKAATAHGREEGRL